MMDNLISTFSAPNFSKVNFGGLVQRKMSQEALLHQYGDYVEQNVNQQVYAQSPHKCRRSSSSTTASVSASTSSYDSSPHLSILKANYINIWSSLNSTTAQLNETMENVIAGDGWEV